MNTKEKGNITEAIVFAELVKLGKSISIPFGDNQRYDLIIDNDGAFVRVQCKTGRLRNGAVLFNPFSCHGHRKKSQQNYKGQADVFCVYCPDTQKIYMVPVDKVSNNSGSLRITAPKNNHLHGVLWAADYELKVMPLSFNG